jgi:hypothetical protein
MKIVHCIKRLPKHADTQSQVVNQSFLNLSVDEIQVIEYPIHLPLNPTLEA